MKMIKVDDASSLSWCQPSKMVGGNGKTSIESIERTIRLSMMANARWRRWSRMSTALRRQVRAGTWHQPREIEPISKPQYLDVPPTSLLSLLV